MKKTICTTLSALFLFLALSITVVQAEEKVVYDCPIEYSEWRAVGGHFSGGYRGVCDYYTTLSDEDQAIFKENADYTYSGALPSLTLREWMKNNVSLDGKGGIFWVIIK